MFAVAMFNQTINLEEKNKKEKILEVLNFYLEEEVKKNRKQLYKEKQEQKAQIQISPKK